MKSIITILSTAMALTVAVAASGFEFDAAVVVSIGFASGLAGMFVSNYSRAPRYSLDPVRTPAAEPARRARSTRHSEAGVEFATFATFNTMVG